MPDTYNGKNLEISIYGNSHGEEIGVKAKGLPTGFCFDLGELCTFLGRRAPGRSEFSTPRKEEDLPIFMGGTKKISENLIMLDGEEFHAKLKNTDQRPSDYIKDQFIPRPSHADYPAYVKYGASADLSGGGHFSGRLTAPLCIVGGICLQYLRSVGIDVFAHIYSVGSVTDTPFDPVNVSKKEFEALKRSPFFPTIDGEVGERMKDEIRDARTDNDSVGGIAEVCVIGLPIGLGEHMFAGVENRISSIIFGIPAVKGIEFGNGFDAARLRGSQNNDAFVVCGDKLKTRTNNSGGILGGMTNGMPLLFRVAIKPTPSIGKEQDSVSLPDMNSVKLSIGGRHDPCILPRAIPAIEAATAVAVCDLLADGQKT